MQEELLEIKLIGEGYDIVAARIPLAKYSDKDFVRSEILRSINNIRIKNQRHDSEQPILKEEDIEICYDTIRWVDKVGFSETEVERSVRIVLIPPRIDWLELRTLFPNAQEELPFN